MAPRVITNGWRWHVLCEPIPAVPLRRGRKEARYGTDNDKAGVFCSGLVAISIGLAFSLVGCGDDVDATCSRAWCTVVDDCTTESVFSDCMDACAEELSQAQSISSECASAVRSQNVCLAELTCAELEAWATEVPNGMTVTRARAPTMTWTTPALGRRFRKV